MARKLDMDVVVRLLGDASGFSGAVKKAQWQTMAFSKKLDVIGKQMQSMGRAMTMGVTLPIVAGLGLSVKAASDLGESMNKVSVVFGNSAKTVKQWGDTTAKSMGQSKTQALEAAATFGNLFKTMGIGQREAADMSMRLTTLASDLASFNNIDPTEALVSLRSGLVGEAEPMRRLGVLLSEAAVKAKAYQMGLASVGTELTEQQKVSARYALILEQTQTAQGDFARTSDELANKSRTLKAQLTDTAAKLGTSLLPVVTDLADKLSRLLDRFNSLSAGTKDVVVKTLLFAAALGPLAYLGGTVLRVVSAMITVYKALRTALFGAAAAQEVLNATQSAGQRNIGRVNSAALGGGKAAAAGAAGLTPAAITAISAAVVAAVAASPFIVGKIVEATVGNTRYGGEEKKGMITGGSKGGGTAGAGRYQAYKEATKGAVEATAAIGDAIARMGSKAATATGEAFDRIRTDMTRLRELAAKGFPFGDLKAEHTDAQLRSLRDKIQSALNITRKEADRIMASMFKDWRPQDVLVPKINEAAAKAEARLKTLRERAAQDIKFGRADVTNLINGIASVTAAFGRMGSAARTAGDAAANALLGGSYRGHFKANGGIVTKPEFTILGEAGPEAVIPLTRPARAAEVMRQAGLAGAGGEPTISTINVNVVLPGGTTLIGAAEDVGRILAPHVARALGRTNARAQRRR